MTKEMFIACHDALIEHYLEQHPGATAEEAYDKTAHQAYERTREAFADMMDQVRRRAKDRLP